MTRSWSSLNRSNCTGAATPRAKCRQEWSVCSAVASRLSSAPSTFLNEPGAHTHAFSAYSPATQPPALLQVTS